MFLKQTTSMYTNISAFFLQPKICSQTNKFVSSSFCTPFSNPFAWFQVIIYLTLGLFPCNLSVSSVLIILSLYAMPFISSTLNKNQRVRPTMRGAWTWHWNFHSHERHYLWLSITEFTVSPYHLIFQNYVASNKFRRLFTLLTLL